MSGFLDNMGDAQDFIERFARRIDAKISDPVTDADLHDALVAIYKKLDDLKPAEVENTEGYSYRQIVNTVTGVFTDTRYDYAGSVIYVDRLRWADGTGNAKHFNGAEILPLHTEDKIYSIKLDSATKDPIFLREGDIIRVNHFDRVFLSKAYSYVCGITLVVLSGEFVTSHQKHFPYIVNRGSETLHRPARVNEDGHVYNLIVDPVTHTRIAKVDANGSLQAALSGVGITAGALDVNATFGGSIGTVKLEGDTSGNVAEVDANKSLETHLTGVSITGGKLDVNAAAAPGNSIIEGGASAVEADVSVNNELLVKVNDSLPAGTNNIGDVDVLSLPALPAGTNNIGDVDVLSLPSIPAGANVIGDVGIDGSLPAGSNNIGDVDVLSLPALPAGTNNIGDVDVLTLPSLPAGSNNIGDVDIASALPAGTNNIGVVTGQVDNETFVVKTYDWTSAQTAQDVWTPAGGKKFVICDIVLTVSADCTVTLFDETDSTTLRILKGTFKDGGGVVMNYRKPYVSAAANNDLKITTSATGGFLTVSGYEV
jgi:hypothetical protein